MLRPQLFPPSQSTGQGRVRMVPIFDERSEEGKAKPRAPRVQREGRRERERERKHAPPVAAAAAPKPPKPPPD
eukprot:COSAG05_NODE_17872_length_318_cov_0.461187_1_plen_72_part_01